jgi:hypothetical protein
VIAAAVGLLAYPIQLVYRFLLGAVHERADSTDSRYSDGDELFTCWDIPFLGDLVNAHLHAGMVVSRIAAPSEALVLDPANSVLPLTHFCVGGAACVEMGQILCCNSRRIEIRSQQISTVPNPERKAAAGQSGRREIAGYDDSAGNAGQQGKRRRGLCA